MKLERQQVEHIAELARLELDGEELTLYQEQLSAILDYFDQLQAVDTDRISPTASVLSLQGVMREDAAESPMGRDEILANAPQDEDGCFEVPAVLD
jgi:aspartyl-tRNA(Asn)/glutamyl-tRNA(Gln) amidotransferase subunit C